MGSDPQSEQRHDKPTADAGNTEQPNQRPDSEQPAKKSKIGLLGIVITAIVGFILEDSRWRVLA
jgi:hypothetical protein